MLAGLVNAGRAVDYEHEIKPLLAAKCTSCHGALAQESGLRLDAGSLIRAGGDTGPVVVPGTAEASLLVQRLTAEDPAERMPPEGEGEPLDTEQIALVAAWINQGAPYPADELAPADPTKHWAYQTLVRPAAPTINDPQWSHPIDAFIAQEHQDLGLEPVEVADGTTLLRRLYLDLIGLPPTPEQQLAFEAENTPEAWTDEVNSLLDNPHYGERWGRHWMDVWRYSDWSGYKKDVRNSQKHIWRWRDWIINSLNADKGYDRMILEMLAGDELAPNDPEVLPATGFLARNYRNNNRDMWLDATVEHSAKAFLGLTINCARCHDHKYDPIPQPEYYQFRAIFEPHKLRMDQLPEQPDTEQDGIPRAYDADLQAETYLYVGGNEKHPDKDHPMTPAIPAVLGGQLEISPVALNVDTYFPALLPHAAEAQLAEARNALAAAKQELAAAKTESATDESNTEEASSDKKPADLRTLELNQTAALLALRSLEARQAADRAKHGLGEAGGSEGETDLQHVAQAAAAAEAQFKAQAAVVSVRKQELALLAAEQSDEKDTQKKQQAIAEAKQLLDEAWQKLTEAQNNLANAKDKYTPVGTEYPHTSSGRRLALARWITARENPLTARVAVNHIWLRHFGAPLVDNVFDFGLRSPRPRHADLLDWLAVELMENNWSMKHLHRLIVTSRVWQLASATGDHIVNLEIDPDNHYLWRTNVRRLEAEIVRDNVMAVAGQLDLSLGGADIDYLQGETSPRRSIYLRHAYEKQMTMLVQFDAASPNECYRRSESIIPQQALALINSSLSLGQSRLLARQLREKVADTEQELPSFVEAAFRQILARPPAEQELSLCLEFLAKQSATLAETDSLTIFRGGSEAAVKPATDPLQRAQENLVHVLMNHNDFVTVR
ncbi:MAG: PSD1 domain-containing protein [Planctomycetales bacterium]|nr:PSD1 domain-containing protein [Planctomycetales bacterium]